MTVEFSWKKKEINPSATKVDCYCHPRDGDGSGRRIWKVEEIWQRTQPVAPAFGSVFCERYASYSSFLRIESIGNIPIITLT